MGSWRASPRGPPFPSGLQHLCPAPRPPSPSLSPLRGQRPPCSLRFGSALGVAPAVQTRGPLPHAAWRTSFQDLGSLLLGSLPALCPVFSGSRDPGCFLATGGLGVPHLSPEAGTEDKVGMAWSGRPAAPGGRTRAGDGRVRGKGAPRRTMWAARSRSPCRLPASKGHSLPSQSTCGLSLLTCAAWPHSGRLAPHLGERVGQSTRAGAWVSMGGWRPP